MGELNGFNHDGLKHPYKAEKSKFYKSFMSGYQEPHRKFWKKKKHVFNPFCSMPLRKVIHQDRDIRHISPKSKSQALFTCARWILRRSGAIHVLQKTLNLIEFCSRCRLIISFINILVDQHRKRFKIHIELQEQVPGNVGE